MPENSSAEMPKVEDTIPTMQPGESPEDYKKRLVATSSEPMSDEDKKMLEDMARGTYRDKDKKEEK